MFCPTPFAGLTPWRAFSLKSFAHSMLEKAFIQRTSQMLQKFAVVLCHLGSRVFVILQFIVILDLTRKQSSSLTFI